MAAGAVPAVAQTQLYLLTAGPWTSDCNQSPCEPGRVIQVDLDRQQVVAQTPVRHSRSFVTRPRVTPDGRHVVWFGSEHAGDAPRVLPVVLSLFDIGARHQTTSFAADPTLNAVRFSLHPSVVRGFFQLSEFGPVVVAEPGRIATLPPPCAQSLLGGRSGDGRRLSFWCGLETAVMDSDSGRILARIPEVYGSHTLNETGTELFAAYWDWEGFYLPEYQRRDVATGATLAWRQAPADEFDGWVWGVNWRTGHFYAGGRHGLTVLDAATFEPVGRIPRYDNQWMSFLALDPDRSLGYIAWESSSPQQDLITLTAFDTRTLVTVGAMAVPRSGHFVGMVLGPRPPVVSNLAIVVDQRLATLAWTIGPSRSIATEQVVEVGFSPGETVARLSVAAGATSMTVPGVPPGRYYVRIRSVNGSGLGGPSNEVLVDVP